MYSTVPPWLRPWPSLIDAVTGAPGKAFLPCGSEVVSFGSITEPCTDRLLSGWQFPNACLPHSLMEQIYHKRRELSMLCGGKRGEFMENLPP